MGERLLAHLFLCVFLFEFGDFSVEKVKDGMKDGLLDRSEMTIEEAREFLDEFFRGHMFSSSMLEASFSMK